MAYASVTVRDMVEKSVHHRWSVPEFQRGFVWKPTQVRDLIDSLWRGYPIGTLLVWDSRRPVLTRSAPDGQGPSQWVVDGQQRTTALCILSGRKPYWWNSNESWDAVLRRYDIRFDVHAKAEPYFWVASAAHRKVKTRRYIPVSELLSLDTSKDEDQKKMMELAKQVKLDGLCDGMDAMEVYTRLDRVRKIRDAEVVVVTVDNELEDVVDIFARLNSKGTRVREADIYLGIVAARSPGWVRDNFLPFMNDLEDAGFSVSPSLVFRSLSAIGQGKVNFKAVEDTFWNADQIGPAWKRTKSAWGLLKKHMKEVGLSGNALLPADNVLVSTVALLDKFPQSEFGKIFYWLLQALRLGRYSGSSNSALDEDLREIGNASTLEDALTAMLARLRYVPPMEAKDFLRDYSDSRFGRLLLYLIAYSNQAQDWDQAGLRIGFDSDDLVAGFEPQYHHVFPRKFLQGKVPAESIEALANIAVIGPKINIRISAQDPMNYVKKYKISEPKLKQQHIFDLSSTAVDDFPSWLQQRAELLTKAANEFLESQRGGLALPAVVSAADADVQLMDAAE
jgi:hypothetical protein